MLINDVLVTKFTFHYERFDTLYKIELSRAISAIYISLWEIRYYLLIFTESTVIKIYISLWEIRYCNLRRRQQRAQYHLHFTMRDSILCVLRWIFRGHEYLHFTMRDSILKTLCLFSPPPFNLHFTMRDSIRIYTQHRACLLPNLHFTMRDSILNARANLERLWYLFTFHYERFDTIMPPYASAGYFAFTFHYERFDTCPEWGGMSRAERFTFHYERFDTIVVIYASLIVLTFTFHYERFDTRAM